jgi:hypothetical protein
MPCHYSYRQYSHYGCFVSLNAKHMTREISLLGRAAEWFTIQPGSWAFREIFEKL